MTFQINASRYAIVIALSLCLDAQVASASSQNCLALLQAKAFSIAGACFEKKGRSMGPGNKLPVIQRYNKGRWLKNAALAYERAAKERTDIAGGKTFLAKAHALLTIYISEELYENEQRALVVRKRLRALQKKIGFATFSINTNNDKAQICLIRGTFNKCHTGRTWTQIILPGSYTLVVVYTPKNKRLHTIKLIPGQKRHFQFYKSKSMTLQSKPSNIAVYQAGRYLGNTPLQLKMAPGRYTLTFAHANPCYQRISKRIDITTKITKTRTVALAFQPKPGMNRAPSNGLAWTSTIGGAVLIGFGIVTQWYAANLFAQSSAYQEEHNRLISGDKQRYLQLRDEANTQAWIWQSITIGSTGLGIAGIVVGITQFSKKKADAPRHCQPLPQ